jgi:hypothetical protein
MRKFRVFEQWKRETEIKGLRIESRKPGDDYSYAALDAFNIIQGTFTVAKVRQNSHGFLR